MKHLLCKLGWHRWTPETKTTNFWRRCVRCEILQRYLGAGEWRFSNTEDWEKSLEFLRKHMPKKYKEIQEHLELREEIYESRN